MTATAALTEVTSWHKPWAPLLTQHLPRVPAYGPESNRSVLCFWSRSQITGVDFRDTRLEQWLHKKAFRLNWQLPTGPCLTRPGPAQPWPCLSMTPHSYCSHLFKQSSNRNAQSWRQQHCSLPLHPAQACFITSDGWEVATGICPSELWLKVPN